MSTPFIPDVGDLEFVLFDQLEVHELLAASDAYESLDRDTLRATLHEAARMATDVLHPINASGDRQGCKLDSEGNITTPEGYREAWQQMVEGGWITPDAPEELGGAGLPRALSAAVNDMLIGANSAFMITPGLTASAARVVAEFGVPGGLGDVSTRRLFRGDWSGTMCLTESGAGSSVGDSRAKATPTETEGVFLLEGEKIFISGGDNDYAENVIHLVLARTPGAPSGSKGLSLFMVPKYLFDEEGNLGERNGVKVVGIEEKMGIHGSATCTLVFGAEAPCKAWLVGEHAKGISQMFRMMNEARILVAGQGVAAASAAYNFALNYARERIQGAPLRPKPGQAARVPIAQHPDVRRMLMTLKVMCETMRAARIRINYEKDRLECTSDEAEKKKLQGRADLLIPVLKAHCTDLGFEMAALGVQVYGGYGYISEYPVEQLVRDTKIQSIYEGTNGIQAMDLLGRKMRFENGALFKAWLIDATGQIGRASAAGFAKEAEQVGKSVAKLAEAAQHLGAQAASGNVELAFCHGVPFLKAFGVVLLGLEALDQARVSAALAASGDSRALHKGLNLRFYVAHVLPQAVAYCRTVLASDDSCLDPELFA